MLVYKKQKKKSQKTNSIMSPQNMMNQSRRTYWSFVNEVTVAVTEVVLLTTTLVKPVKGDSGGDDYETLPDLAERCMTRGDDHEKSCVAL